MPPLLPLALFIQENHATPRVEETIPVTIRGTDNAIQMYGRGSRGLNIITYNKKQNDNIIIVINIISRFEIVRTS